MSAPKLRFNEFNDEWIENNLGSVCSFSKGKDLSKADLYETGEPCILYGELYTKYGPVINEVHSRTAKNSDSLIKAKKYDVLIPSSGETAIDIACASSLNLDNVLIGGDLNILTPSTEVNGHFLSYQINGKRKYKLSTLAQGATVTHLYADSIKKLSCYFPSYDEQKKITSFLQLIDQKIQLQQEKINLLKEKKKGYMQKIFNQELRFKDANGKSFPNWEGKLVSDILKLNLREVDKPTNAYMRLGLRSHARGTFHELVTNVESVSMDKLYVVHEGDFIINITFAWEQALAVADNTDHGKLVSHRFPTYLFKENHHKDFYKYFFTTKYFKYCLGNASPGGAGRNRVLNKAAFMNIQVNIPTFDEQLLISNFLSNLDKKLLFEEQKLELLQQKKQAFMHQMFV
ncbi:restriction endonuclease subunit S [Bacillus velezensis]|uniref:restriction endonuclease subunit S n=1 Tax=Bacillus velezensis TaxID=492670 RepID=UPI00064C6EC8|nr:restriction endonuclease subunit S [Bacillus velezensis]AKL78466.1 type I site-specific deoxyribonuclease specificity subunit [Bacillus velezensis]MEC2166155.1 restriction endonuclease subunit S [Bacillus velezensis]MED1775869.1 restriction endonuclease subunit S [Bacillus velezensis]RXK25084.1 hypothetical protein P42_20585 [Bacillus velezensis]TNU60663.1 restriction endonuclease subunit S [Bacillus velezensis]